MRKFRNISRAITISVLAPLVVASALSLATPTRANAHTGVIAVGLVLGFAGAYDGLTRFGSWLGEEIYDIRHGA